MISYHQGSRLDHILNPDEWTKLMSQVLDAITLVVDSIIKTPGFCPVDTGRLRGGHATNLSEKLVKYITNSVFYWVYVVFGTYKMSPRNYLYNAIISAFASGAVDQIVRTRLRAFVGGR